VLGLPDPEQARQQRDAARARQAPERDRELVRRRAEWQARPHGRLTDKQLSTAVGEAEQRQAKERAAAEQARREVAEREPAVAAGRGPEVARLDAERDRLRQRAQVQSRAEDIQRRWQAVVNRAGDAAERQAHAEIDAERTRRWQYGKRDRLTAEAAAHRAEVQRAQDEAKELARQAAELQQELGGPKVWRLAAEQAERAEARYPQDRREAQREDETALTRAQERVARLDCAAAEAGTHRDELIAEQQLRDALPQTHRITEGLWRLEAHRQDLTRALEQLAVEPDLASSEVDWEREYHERTLDRGVDIDRDGPSLGLSPSAHDPGRNRHRSGIAWSKSAIRVILTNPATPAAKSGTANAKTKSCSTSTTSHSATPPKCAGTTNSNGSSPKTSPTQ
jgi:hypothetical protein